MRNNSIFASYAQIVFSAVLFGFLIFGGGMMRKYGFSLMEVMILPALIVVVILFGFVRKDIKNFYGVPLWVSLTYFLLNIIGHFSQYAPLFFGVSVSLTLFLLYTQPVWTILISVAFLKEKFTRHDAAITLTIIAGLVLLFAPWQDMAYSVIGIVFGLIAGMEMSGWIVFTSHFSKKEAKPLTTTFFINFYAAIPFLLALPLIGKIFPNPEISAFSFDKPLMIMVYVFLFAVIVCIGARLLFCRGAKHIDNVYLGLLLLLEPVTGSFLDVVFFGNILTWNMITGGVLILAANVILILKNTKTQNCESI